MVIWRLKILVTYSSRFKWCVQIQMKSESKHLLAPNTWGTLDFTYAAATVYWVKIELAPKISISSQKLTYRKPDQQSQASWMGQVEASKQASALL